VPANKVAERVMSDDKGKISTLPKVFIDTREWSFLIEILEEMDDELLAASYLKQLNDLHRAWGKHVLNLSPEKNHIEWKREADQLQQYLSDLVALIRGHKK
jgi:hypothetical protein